MAVTVAETGSSASFVDVEPRSPASEVGLSDVPHIESPALAWTEVPVTMPGRVRLEVAFHATASKDPTLPESNEDAWAFDEAGDGVVMLDGATESFAARRWARLLAGQWATGGADWLATAQSLYARAMDGVELSWAQEAAAQRGSFATVAAIRGVDHGLEATCVGDTCVMLVAGERLLASHPITSPAQFTSAPVALPSDPTQLDSARELLGGCRVLLPVPAEGLEAWLATDAVAAWLLAGSAQERQSRIRAVRAVASQEEFVRLVADQRAAGLMKTDDSTVVRVLLEVQR